MPFLLTCALSLAVLEHAGGSAAQYPPRWAPCSPRRTGYSRNYTKGLLRISPAVAAMICPPRSPRSERVPRDALGEKLEKELGYES